MLLHGLYHTDITRNMEKALCTKLFPAALFPMLGQWDKRTRKDTPNRKETSKLWWEPMQPLKTFMKTFVVWKRIYDVV